ncbi:Cat operon transcriptional regulator [Yokenella regensburgei]|nr:Cat operon transcriptional regulator [Yokenella regensburgei]
MNLRRLKYFVKIVDIGSLTQAAEVLHIAQPALSQQVATLEGEMNQQLLIRTKRGVTPTDAGKILYTHARTILRQCEQAQLAVGKRWSDPQRAGVDWSGAWHGGLVHHHAAAAGGAQRAAGGTGLFT